MYHQTERVTAAYFPDVDEIILVPRGQFTRIPTSPHQYVVIMSHQFDIDLEATKQLLPTSVRYIGLLGSRTRINRLIETIKNDGLGDSLMFDKLHAPVGLDLGAKTPEEITLSIMAELVAIHHKATGGYLSERKTWHGTSR
ncbi:MAG TPA: XdhC family protein, partial [Candidatus Angelobacter sp.]|nr:XdhC family protein [Candidatus Angelobacter sp.]